MLVRTADTVVQSDVSQSDAGNTVEHRVTTLDGGMVYLNKVSTGQQRGYGSSVEVDRGVKQRTKNRRVKDRRYRSKIKVFH